jgi:hypothetical protein
MQTYRVVSAACAPDTSSTARTVLTMIPPSIKHFIHPAYALLHLNLPNIASQLAQSVKRSVPNIEKII